MRFSVRICELTGVGSTGGEVLIARAGATEGGTVHSRIGASVGGMRTTITTGSGTTTRTTCGSTSSIVRDTYSGNMCRGGGTTHGISHLTGLMGKVTWSLGVVGKRKLPMPSY